MKFAVLDFETTGKFARFDRVLEVGLVLLDSSLNVELEFETLVNPSRDPGPQEIHGIQSSWLLDAPSFEEIAGAFSDFLRGRVVIAHNARFDASFAESEFKRLDNSFSFDWIGEGGLPTGVACTKRLSRHFFGSQAQSLGWLASAFGVNNERPHAAIYDARVTAEIFVEMFSQSSSVRDEVSAVGMHSEPRILSSLIVSKPRPQDNTQERSKLDAIVDGLPPTNASSGLTDFMTVLMSSLLDQELSEHQTRELAFLAEELKLGRDQVLEARIAVFDAIAAHFWSNNVLSDYERGALQRIGEVLGVSDEQLASSLNSSPEGKLDMKPQILSSEVFLLTGFSSERKAEISQQLRSMGKMTVDGFSKKVDVVLANDPDTQSGKAKSARKSGVPVLGAKFVDYLQDRADSNER